MLHINILYFAKTFDRTILEENNTPTLQYDSIKIILSKNTHIYELIFRLFLQRVKYIKCILIKTASLCTVNLVKDLEIYSQCDKTNAIYSIDDIVLVLATCMYIESMGAY
jgi:hypothetical protein